MLYFIWTIYHIYSNVVEVLYIKVELLLEINIVNVMGGRSWWVFKLFCYSISRVGLTDKLINYTEIQ